MSSRVRSRSLRPIAVGLTALLLACGGDPDRDEEENTDPVDWSAIECGYTEVMGADTAVMSVDQGPAGWDPSVSVGPDGVMQTDFGQLYPITEPVNPIPDGQDGGALFGEWCVRRTNWFRSLEGLEPYLRMIQDEPCVADEARIAEANGTAHELSCDGRAQNACGGTGDPIGGGNFCFRLHWDEAQDAGGHYGGQMRTEPRFMACGYYRTWVAEQSTGSHRIFQDFYNDTTPGQFTGAASELFASAAPPPAGSLRASAVAVGGNHTCAIVDGGEVRCWGDSIWGQLGDGLVHRVRAVPGDPLALAGPATQVVAGHVHTCALLDDGRVQCWGGNEYAQLGIDGWRGHFRQYAEHYTPTPTLTIDLPDGDPVVELAAAHSSTCARLASGAVHCWGYAMNGVLGRPSEVGDGEAPWASFGGIVGPESEKLAGLGQLRMGVAHGCGLTTEGAVRCWGRDFRGQAGDGQRETQYKAQSLGDVAPADQDPLTPRTAVGLSAGVSQVHVGAEHSCAILDNGMVQCWGSNRYGQLGFAGDYDTDADPHAGWEDTPVELCLEEPAIDLALGGAHSCALLESGRVQCWGSANHGKLGNGYYGVDSPTPVTVSGLTDVVDIESRHMHTCALTAQGQVYCWGLDYYGQLGDGDSVDQAEPVLVSGF